MCALHDHITHPPFTERRTEALCDTLRVAGCVPDVSGHLLGATAMRLERADFYRVSSIRSAHAFINDDVLVLELPQPLLVLHHQLKPAQGRDARQPHRTSSQRRTYGVSSVVEAHG
eukprot:5400085-Pleurochrysis_carterae.AAC.1